MKTSSSDETIKFCDAFVKLESKNFHNFINKKLVVAIFVKNSFIIVSQKIFGLEGQEGK